MARTMGPGLNIIGANPYPLARDKEPDFFMCEVCDRRIGSKDWTAHKNSKKHRAYEDELRRAKDNEAATFSSRTGYKNDDSFGQGAWKQDDDALYPRGGDSDTCYGCGEVGHQKRECPKSAGGYDSRPCYGCGEVGHQKRECPNGNGGRGGGSRDECFNCFEVGHRKPDCPNPQVFKCRNCEEKGHKAQDCPKPKDWSKVQCHNCKKFGHTSKRCQEPPAEDTNGGGWDEAGAGVDPVTTTTADWTEDPPPAGDNWGDATAGAGW